MTPALAHNSICSTVEEPHSLIVAMENLVAEDGRPAFCVAKAEEQCRVITLGDLSLMVVPFSSTSFLDIE